MSQSKTSRHHLYLVTEVYTFPGKRNLTFTPLDSHSQEALTYESGINTPHFQFGTLHSVSWVILLVFSRSVCPTLCVAMDCSIPGFPVLHHLLELAQTQVHWVSDAIQPSHPLSSPSLPAFSLSQHQSLFQWVNSSHAMAEVLELQLQHLFFKWIFRADFL